MIWHVSPTGVAASPGTALAPTSIANACAAGTGAQPGDEIWMAGTWTDFGLVLHISGTSGAKITFKPEPGKTAILDGYGANNVVMSATNLHDLVFDGVQFHNYDHVNRPAANRGLIFRGCSGWQFKNCDFDWMQMQLYGCSSMIIGDAAADRTNPSNRWRNFVASYVTDVNGVKQPQTSGDMIAFLPYGNAPTWAGCTNCLVQGNDMANAGHALVSVGNGFGGSHGGNIIRENILRNPWYKSLILADDGAGAGAKTLVEHNDLLDCNSVPTLYSTVVGQVGALQTSSEAVQFSGSNYIFRRNLVKNAVATYGPIGLGGRWYQQGTWWLVESCNNEIYENTISFCKGAGAITFEEFYTQADADYLLTTTTTGTNALNSTSITVTNCSTWPLWGFIRANGVDIPYYGKSGTTAVLGVGPHAAIAAGTTVTYAKLNGAGVAGPPRITGNEIYDNIIKDGQGTPYDYTANPPQTATGTAHYEPILVHAVTKDPVWIGMNGNRVYNNELDYGNNVLRRYFYDTTPNPDTFVNTTTTLTAFNGIDANVYGNTLASTSALVTGAAALAIADAIAAAGARTATAAATCPVTFAATTTGKRTATGAGALHPTFTVTAAGTAGKLGAASLLTTLTVTATGAVGVTQLGAASLLTTLTVTANGAVGNTQLGSVAMTTTLDLAADGTITMRRGSAAMPTTLDLAAAGSVAAMQRGSATMPITVDLAAAGSVVSSPRGSAALELVLAAAAAGVVHHTHTTITSPTGATGILHPRAGDTTELTDGRATAPDAGDLARTGAGQLAIAEHA